MRLRNPSYSIIGAAPARSTELQIGLVVTGRNGHISRIRHWTRDRHRMGAVVV